MYVQLTSDPAFEEETGDLVAVHCGQPRISCGVLGSICSVVEANSYKKQRKSAALL